MNLLSVTTSKTVLGLNSRTLEIYGVREGDERKRFTANFGAPLLRLLGLCHFLRRAIATSVTWSPLGRITGASSAWLNRDTV